MERPKIFGGGDISLSRGTFYVYRRSGDNYELAGSDMYTNNSTTFGTAITFLQEGEYMVELSFWFRTDENGTPVFSVYDPSDSDTTVSVSLCRKFTVYDADCDIQVTYATDKEHPFDTDRLSAAGLPLYGAALREDTLKKRLAYSSVSQVSRPKPTGRPD